MIKKYGAGAIFFILAIFTLFFGDNLFQQITGRSAFGAKEPVATPVSQSLDCSPDDYIPPIGESDPPIGKEICIPSGYVAWISSDPAQFIIPGIYSESQIHGFTFSLFGPVKFTIFGVSEEGAHLVRLADSSLVGNYDGKTVNLVYIDGKVCEHDNFSYTCP